MKQANKDTKVLDECLCHSFSSYLFYFLAVCKLIHHHAMFLWLSPI